jgi:hypothetical protein
MRHFRLFAASAALVVPFSSAFAETATPEGAKSLEQTYAAYFTQAAIDEGIVTIAPDHDGYLVTWDLQKVVALSGIEGAIKIDTLSYRIVPEAADAWTLQGDRLPHVSFHIPNPPSQRSGALDFQGVGLEVAYDPQASEFLRSRLGIETMEGDFQTSDGERSSDAKIVQQGIVLETRAKPSANSDGLDLAIAEAFKSLSETESAPPSVGRGEPAQMNYGISGTVADATFTGLRAREIGEIWKYVAAHFDADEPPPELRARTKAALPFWNQLSAHAEIRQVNFGTPQGAAQLESLRETLNLTGFTKTGAAEIGLDIDGMTLKSELLPPWGGEFWPASLSLDLMASSDGWDEAARVAIDDPSFLADGDLSSETRDKISKILAAGHPKFVLKPGHLRIPTLDLKFEGEARIETGGPVAHFNISVDSLEKTLKLLTEVAKTEPDITPIILGVTFLKGLATTDAEGRLVWEVVATADGEVTVNGTLMPK